MSFLVVTGHDMEATILQFCSRKFTFTAAKNSLQLYQVLHTTSYRFPFSTVIFSFHSFEWFTNQPACLTVQRYVQCRVPLCPHCSWDYNKGNQAIFHHSTYRQASDQVWCAYVSSTGLRQFSDNRLQPIAQKAHAVSKIRDPTLWHGVYQVYLQSQHF